MVVKQMDSNLENKLQNTSNSILYPRSQTFNDGITLPLKYISSNYQPTKPKTEQEISTELQTIKDLELMEGLEQEEKEKISKLINNIYVNNNSDRTEINNKLIDNKHKNKYSAIIFAEEPEYNEYEFGKVTENYKDINFKSSRDCKDVKDIYGTLNYAARFEVSPKLAVIVEKGIKQIINPKTNEPENKQIAKYHLLHSAIDKDGLPRPVFPTVQIKEVDLNDCTEMLVSENKEKGSRVLYLPKTNYDWKKELLEKRNENQFYFQ